MERAVFPLMPLIFFELIVKLLSTLTQVLILYIVTVDRVQRSVS